MKNKITAWCLLLMGAAFIAVSSWAVNWTGDDAVYCFVVGSDPSWNEDAAAMEPVRSVADVARSQYNHYFQANGRVWPHVVVQLFTGPLSQRAFAVANGLMFALVVWLLCRIEVGPRQRGPMVCLLNLAALLLLFPAVIEGSTVALWTNIALSVNYLWVVAAVLVFLLLLRRSDGGRPVPMAAAVAAGLLTGWSNEAFAVPLCAATGLFWLARRCRFRSRAQAALCIALWAGAVPLVFSPGTLGRIASADDAGTMRDFLLRTFDCYAGLKLVYVLALLLAAWAALRRKACAAFLRANRFLLVLLVIDLVFTFYAHSYPHSMCLIEFISLILLVQAAVILWPSLTTAGAAATAIPAAALAVLLCFGAAGTLRVSKAYREMAARLAATPEPFTYIDSPKINPALQPLITGTTADLLPDNYSATAILRLYGKRTDGRPLIVNHADYDLLTGEPPLSAGRRIAGDAHAVEGRDYWFIPATGADTARCVRASFAGRDLSSRTLPKRLIYAVTGNLPYSAVLPATPVTIDGDTLLAVRKPSTDIPLSINFER